jgi:ubiquinone biosynthesis protein
MAFGDIPRLMRAAYVLGREGALTLFPLPQPMPFPVRLGLGLARLIERPSASRRAAGERLSVALNRLGPSYVKLGQFLATRPDVVGKEAALALTALQDNVPPFSEEAARAEIAEALGRPVQLIYTSFSPSIAAASIAQVHRAELVDHDGVTRTVAVKVLRPGVAGRFQRDLSSFYLAARMAERFVRRVSRLRPVAIVDTLARSIALEMDFRLEAAALSEMAENTAGDKGFRVPAVDWERTARTVLTMEWVDGIKLNRVEEIRAAGHDMVELGARIIQSFLRQAMRDGFFHADMHQGNLFVDPAGTLVAVDLGITGRLGKKERRFLAEILYGFIRRDYRRVAEVHFDAGYVPSVHDIDTFAQALRAIGEPLQGHTASEISMARLLTQLFDVTELFDMQTRPELILLQKTMVVVEGVARTLDPRLDMWRTADPVVREWVARNLGPVGRMEDAGDVVRAALRIAGTLPAIADRLEERLKEPLEPERGERRTRVAAGALWIGAAALVAIAVKVWLG